MILAMLLKSHNPPFCEEYATDARGKNSLADTQEGNIDTEACWPPTSRETTPCMCAIERKRAVMSGT